MRWHIGQTCWRQSAVRNEQVLVHYPFLLPFYILRKLSHNYIFNCNHMDVGMRPCGIVPTKYSNLSANLKAKTKKVMKPGIDVTRT